MSPLNPNPDLLDLLSPLDWLVFVGVLATTFIMVLIGNRQKEKLSEPQKLLDYLLMGRRLTLPMFIATLVATWYGGIFGVTQIAFDHGIYNFLTQGIFWYLTYIFFALFMVDKIRKTEAVTLPDMLGKMFGPRSEKIGAILNYLNVLPIAYAVSLGLLLQAFFGGNLQIHIIVGVGFVVCYSMLGGFRAVVYSDLVQFTVMCLAVALVLYFSVLSFGGLDFLKGRLPPSHFSLLGGHSLLATLVWGFIALSTLVDPNFYQRCFAAKNGKTAKRGILLSTCVWVIFDICTTGGAMYAAATVPEAKSSTAYLVYSLQIMPAGFRGLVLAGLLATVLSTLDSYVFTASTTLVYDLGPRRLQKSLKAHHWGILVTGILAVGFSGYFEGNIKEIWKALGSFSAAALLLPILVGHFFPGRLNDSGFTMAALAAILATLTWRNLELSTPWSYFDPIYAGFTASLWVIIAFVAKNHLWRDSDPKGLRSK